MSKALQWKNTGSAEVHIVTLWIWDYTIFSPAPAQWVQVTFQADNTAAMPAGDWVIRLEADEVEPDGVLPAPASPDLQFGLTSPDTTAYVARSPEDGELTLRSAQSTTTVYVMTVEQVGTEPVTPGRKRQASVCFTDGHRAFMVTMRDE